MADHYAYDIIVSVEDLMGRLTRASELRLSQSDEPDNALLLLGLPNPQGASNDDLDRLVPIYEEVIKDVRQNGDDSTFLRPLAEATREYPDAAILLLYFLSYPDTVRTYRAGILYESTGESFRFVELCDEITRLKNIGRWCRGAISRSDMHHGSVLASALSILGAVARMSHDTSERRESAAKKYTRRVIFADRGESKGFSEFRSDLANLVSDREDLPHTTVPNAIMVQLHSLKAFYGGNEDKVISIMHGAPRKRDFERALTRIKIRIGEKQYEIFRSILGSSSQTTGEMLHGMKLPLHQKVKEIIPCNIMGCKHPGTFRCGRCKLVSYCSKKCQTLDWKHRGHKQKCRKKEDRSVKLEQVQEAVAAIRGIASPALIAQENLLATNKGLDYIIILKTGSQDCGVIFDHFMGKMMFHTYRKEAPQSPRAVVGMYNLLIGVHPAYKDLIRNQLQGEYGVDPLLFINNAAPAGTPFSRNMISAALLTQDDTLKQNNIFDYVVWGENGEEDCAVEFLDRNDKYFFRISRHQAAAPGDNFYAGVMYKKLVQTHPDLERRIRNQMMEEYGVDPSSADFQNAPEPEHDEELLRRSQDAVRASWPTMSQMKKNSFLFDPGNEKALSSWKDSWKKIN